MGRRWSCWGITADDADKYTAEFQQHGRMIPVYREHGIRAALLEFLGLLPTDATEEQLLEMMKKFQVVHLTTTHEGATPFDERHRRRAGIVGRALVRYVKEAEACCSSPYRYATRTTRTKSTGNAVLAPLVPRSSTRGSLTKTRSFEGLTVGKATFWYTRQHSASCGHHRGSRSGPPLRAFSDMPGLTAMRYSGQWHVVVRGEKQAKELPEQRRECPSTLNVDGKLCRGPAGAGGTKTRQRQDSFLIPISPLFTGANHRNSLWRNIVEINGNRAVQQPSDSMRMQIERLPMAGLAIAGARRLRNVRTATPRSHRGIPLASTWIGIRSPRPRRPRVRVGPAFSRGIRGIFGVHSAYSDGAGTVGDYVQAAKAAGLSFVVFQ